MAACTEGMLAEIFGNFGRKRAFAKLTFSAGKVSGSPFNVPRNKFMANRWRLLTDGAASL